MKWKHRIQTIGNVPFLRWLAETYSRVKCNIKNSYFCPGPSRMGSYVLRWMDLAILADNNSITIWYVSDRHLFEDIIHSDILHVMHFSATETFSPITYSSIFKLFLLWDRNRKHASHWKQFVITWPKQMLMRLVLTRPVALDLMQYFYWHKIKFNWPSQQRWGFFSLLQSIYTNTMWLDVTHSVRAGTFVFGLRLCLS